MTRYRLKIRLFGAFPVSFTAIYFLGADTSVENVESELLRQTEEIGHIACLLFCCLGSNLYMVV